MDNVTHISRLTPDPANARKHNRRNLEMIEDSLREVGFARSIVIDEENRILAGNGTVKAAEQAGLESVLVVDADGDTVVAVRRAGLTEEQKRRLALWDNRAQDTSAWDAQVIAAIESEAPALLEGLFDAGEIDELLELAAAENAVDSGMSEPREKESSNRMLGDPQKDREACYRVG